MLSGIIFINRNGLRWCDAPKEYGPHKALHNRWKRWSDLGVFARIMAGPAAEGTETTTVMIDATYRKAHRTASSLRAKKGALGRPITFFMSVGQVNDYTGAVALLRDLPDADGLIADRAYDADWFRDALKDKEISPAFPVVSSERRPRNTTIGAANGATGSRSCSAG